MSHLILTPEQISVSLENKDGELRLDSRIVCGGFGLKSHSDYQYQVLQKYESKLAELGSVLKTELDNGEIVWYLSEAQVNFAGTLARNTEKAVNFKLKLVKAFELAKQRPAPIELSRREILQLALEAEDRILLLEAQIEADADATILGKAIAKAPNNIRIGDFAKSIGMGQNRYFDELRNDGIIQQTSTLPYQQFINAGYFVVTQIIAGNGRTYPAALITPKGQPYLAKRHSKYISREAMRDAIECQVVALV
ncbi:MAG: phage antirepressor KilAC domain-containing protein [Chroococcidiopsis sp.]